MIKTSRTKPTATAEPLARRDAVALLTDETLAPILGVEPRTLRLWRNTRGLPFIRITSKIIRYREPDVQAWLDRSRTVIA